MQKKCWCIGDTVCKKMLVRWGYCMQKKCWCVGDHAILVFLMVYDYFTPAKNNVVLSLQKSMSK